MARTKITKKKKSTTKKKKATMKRKRTGGRGKASTRSRGGRSKKGIQWAGASYTGPGWAPYVVAQSKARRYVDDNPSESFQKTGRPAPEAL